MHAPDADSDKLPPMRLTEEVCLWVLGTAQAHALRVGLLREDAEDAAMTYVLHLLTLSENSALAPHHLSPAWLYRCIDNWIKNTARQVRRRTSFEVPFPERAADTNVRFVVAATPEFAPEKGAIKRELTERLLDVIARLTPSQRKRFEDLFSEEQDSAGYAASPQRTRNARRQARWALRAPIRALLDEVGLTSDEIRDYLSLLGQAGSPS